MIKIINSEKIISEVSFYYNTWYHVPNFFKILDFLRNQHIR